MIYWHGVGRGGAGGWQTDAHRWLPFSPKSTRHPLSQTFVFVYYYIVAFIRLNSFFLSLLLATPSNHNLNSKTFINRIYPKHPSGKLPSDISISEGLRGVYEKGLSSFSPSLTSCNKTSFYMHCRHLLIAPMLQSSLPQFCLFFLMALILHYFSLQNSHRNQQKIQAHIIQRASSVRVAFFYTW